MVDNASGATSINVPSAGQATGLPAKGRRTPKMLTRVDQLTQIEQELKIDLNQPLKEQDRLNELIDLAKKKRKRTTSVAKVPSASALQVLRRLGSIFTSVYAAVQKMKKDSWLELQFSLVDNSKLNVIPKDQHMYGNAISDSDTNVHDNVVHDVGNQVASLGIGLESNLGSLKNLPNKDNQNAYGASSKSYANATNDNTTEPVSYVNMLHDNNANLKVNFCTL
ncbi:hypothetical protein Tco_0357612 [Tanacetum coccineum]